MLNQELSDFLTQQCKQRRLSFRSLSVNSGLSAGTVHNIVNGKFRPNISTLNALADYLEVKREYLWQMAGLLEDMDYNTETTFSDPQVRFHFAQVDKLPKAKRNVILGVIQALIVNLKSEDIVEPIEATKSAELLAYRRKYVPKKSKD